MKKMLFIINPKAGKMQLKNKLFEVVELFSKEYLVTVVPTQFGGHAAQLAASAKEQGYDLVVCAGGDGTLNETVSGLMEQEERLPVGYIPAGSTNDFATALGLYKTPLKAAEQIVNGRTHTQDVGWFNRQRRFTYIASFGAFTETSYLTDQNLKNVLGHLAYVLEGVKSVAKIKAVPMKIQCDDCTLDGEWLFGAVTNCTTIGGVLRLNDKDLKFNDGLFEMVLIRKPNNLLELNKILASLTTLEYDGDLVQMVHTSKAEFFCQQEVAWTLDGEFAPGGFHVLVENCRKAIEIVY